MIDRWTKTDFDDAALLKSGLSFHKDAIKINGYYKISMKSTHVGPTTRNPITDYKSASQNSGRC